MIDAKEARRMVKNIIKGCPRVRDLESLIAHTEFITSIVLDTIKKVKSKAPNFKVDDEEMELAALMHDIGYCFAEEDIFHPIVGGEFLEERGFLRIARIIRGHTYASDVIRLTGYKSLNADEYKAKTWNHVLIDYASLHAGKPGEKITPDEKFRRFREKRRGKFQQIIDMAEPRLRQEIMDINALLAGDKKVLSRYNFL